MDCVFIVIHAHVEDSKKGGAYSQLFEICHVKNFKYHNTGKSWEEKVALFFCSLKILVKSLNSGLVNQSDIFMLLHMEGYSLQCFISCILKQLINYKTECVYYRGSSWMHLCWNPGKSVVFLIWLMTFHASDIFWIILWYVVLEKIKLNWNQLPYLKFPHVCLLLYN